MKFIFSEFLYDCMKTYSEQFFLTNNMSQNISLNDRWQTDSRAGERKHKVSLEHLVVAESKEMLRKQKNESMSKG